MRQSWKMIEERKASLPVATATSSLSTLAMIAYPMRIRLDFRKQRSHTISVEVITLEFPKPLGMTGDRSAVRKTFY
jgi:hypothetical protein